MFETVDPVTNIVIDIKMIVYCRKIIQIDKSFYCSNITHYIHLYKINSLLDKS